MPTRPAPPVPPSACFARSAAAGKFPRTADPLTHPKRKHQMSKTILITGTSNGFGKDAAITLAKAGHHVFASMRAVAGRNKAAADELKALGIDVVELDVTDDASVETAFKAVHDKTGGKLDVV